MQINPIKKAMIPDGEAMKAPRACCTAAISANRFHSLP
jgi:hypothetical protein